MKTFILSLGMLMIVSAAMAQEKTEEIAWIDLNTAFEQAPAAGKMVLIDFYTDWCGWCKKMDKTTYADSGVIAYINRHFIASKLNPEKSGDVKLDGETYTARQFASGLNITGYPTTCIYIPAGEGEEGPTMIPLSGYLTADKLLSLLQYFGDKAYQTMSYEDYVAGQAPGGK